jgi:hypothetical protein
MGSEVAGNGGGGGGGGRVDGSASDSDMEDEAPALDEEGSGILGPIDDLYMGGFPGGGAPDGFKVG